MPNRKIILNLTIAKTALKGNPKYRPASMMEEFANKLCMDLGKSDMEKTGETSERKTPVNLQD